MILRNFVYFSGITLLIANTLDMLTTANGLLLGAVETNPLIRYGVLTLFLVKIILITATVIVGNVLAERFKISCLFIGVFFTITTVSFSLAVINNVIVIGELL